MTERDQLARPLGRHDPGELRGRERIALRQIAEPRRVVSGDIRTSACATARRRDNGFPPTSTMRTEPDSSTWLRSLTRESYV